MFIGNKYTVHKHKVIQCWICKKKEVVKGRLINAQTNKKHLERRKKTSLSYISVSSKCQARVLNTTHMACSAFDHWLCLGLNIDMSKLERLAHPSPNHFHLRISEEKHCGVHNKVSSFYCDSPYVIYTLYICPYIPWSKISI